MNDPELKIKTVVFEIVVQWFPGNRRFYFVVKSTRDDKVADKNSKLNDEKCLTQLIRKVFKDEFAQQENLISGNISIAKQQIEKVKNQALDLRKSIQFTKNQMEAKVNKINNKLADIQQGIEEIYDYRLMRTMSSRS